MKKILLHIIPLIIMIGCKKDVETPKLKYTESENTVPETSVIVDSSRVQVADLPIHIDNSKYLIFAVGDVRIYESKDQKFSSKIASTSYHISNYNRYEITGFLSNLKFQHIDSTEFRPLTSQILEIHTVTYLQDFYTKNNLGVLVYTLADQDTNKDGIINSNDIKALYLSLINGQQFVKLSKELEEVIDWDFVETQNRLYFRTVEDINKNGNFDQKDNVNYFYVDLKKMPWEAIQYNPL
ncbi:MAG: hypothetical protein Q4B43_09745 [Bacteroidota bacterium]|nr:hypothetical protein [Bacteroidota bacterium]